MPATTTPVTPCLPEFAATAATHFVATPAEIARTLELIANELKTRRGLYMMRLAKAGVPPHELDDALGTLFTNAVRYAHSYDSSKSKINSWIGNVIVGSTASLVYGKSQPKWRRAAGLEATLQSRRDNAEESEAAVAAEGAEPCRAEHDQAVAGFLASLAVGLTPNESALLTAGGVGVLQDRMSREARASYCERFNLTAFGVTRLLKSLRAKLSKHAADHFDLESLAGRPEFCCA